MKLLLIILLIPLLFFSFRYYQLKDLEYNVLYYICPEYDNFRIVGRGFDRKKWSFYFVLEHIKDGCVGFDKYNPSIFQPNWKAWERWTKRKEKYDKSYLDNIVLYLPPSK